MDRISDYEFELPPELIAQTPAPTRTGSRLLVADPGGGLRDGHFAEIGAYLPKDAVLVVNDTKVLPARVFATKDSGGRLEVMFVEPVAGHRWRCLIKGKIRVGMALTVLDREGAPLVGCGITVAETRGDDGVAEVEIDDRFDTAGIPSMLGRAGSLPLPPYIVRPGGATDTDDERYQTVFAAAPGAVAAPTAGLHFTDELLDALRVQGITIAPITLHVGLGTFAPVRVDALDDHRMHLERFEISEQTAALIASGRPIVAVGTTVVRALEAAALRHRRIHGSADGRRAVATGLDATDIFLRPGHRFLAVDHLITNFHLPASTLMVLVSAFAGYELIKQAYAHAVAERYRFFSYGDAMLLRLAADGVTR